MNENNENEWKDVNPVTADLPNKGRTVILLIVGGLALGLLGILGMRIRPLGLAVGSFTFITGIGTLIRRRKTHFRIALIVTIAGFLMLLANPRFGLAAGFAGYFLVTGAIGLVVLGLCKAIKLSWDLGKKY